MLFALSAIVLFSSKTQVHFMYTMFVSVHRTEAMSEASTGVSLSDPVWSYGFRRISRTRGRRLGLPMKYWTKPWRALRYTRVAPRASMWVRYMDGLFMRGYENRIWRWMLSTFWRKSQNVRPVARIASSYLYSVKRCRRYKCLIINKLVSVCGC